MLFEISTLFSFLKVFTHCAVRLGGEILVTEKALLIVRKDLGVKYSLQKKLIWSTDSPSVKYFTDHSNEVHLLRIFCVIYILCVSCFCVCSLLPCGHLLGKG